jgi:hypothetical protein
VDEACLGAVVRMRCGRGGTHMWCCLGHMTRLSEERRRVVELEQVEGTGRGSELVVMRPAGLTQRVRTLREQSSGATGWDDPGRGPERERREAVDGVLWRTGCGLNG